MTGEGGPWDMGALYNHQGRGWEGPTSAGMGWKRHSLAKMGFLPQEPK